MILAALGFALGTLAPAGLQAVARDTLEPVIVELGLGRLSFRTVTAYRVGRTVLLPAGQLFDLAEIRTEPATPTTLAGVIEPAGSRIEIDAVRRRITAGSRSWDLDPTQIAARDGELFVASAALGTALGLEWSVSWSDLAVTAVDPSGLPIAARIAREWRRQLRSPADGQLAPVWLAEGPHRPVDGMVVDYSVFAPTGRPLREAAFGGAVGLDVVGGALTASVENRSTGGQTGVRTEASWSFVRRQSNWLSQIRLGDGIAGGLRPRSLRGISFGNAPFLRPNQIGEVAFTGDLGPGWQVEAFRGGRSIGFDSVNATGKFSIDAPIAYGENPVEFVAYGPFGEVRRFNRAYRVEANRLPAGRMEYSASAGACRTDRCAATGNVDLRYGLSTRWTLGAGIDQFWRADSLPNLFHPYATLAGSLGNAIGLQADVVLNAVSRLGLRYEPSTALILSLEASKYASNVRAPILTPDGRSSQITLNGLYRPIERLAGFFIDGSVEIVRNLASTVTSGRVGASYQWRQLQLMPTIRWQRTRTATGPALGETTVGVSGYVLPMPKLGRFLGQFTARTLIETRTNFDPSALAAFLGRNAGRMVRVEFGGGWNRYQGTTLSLNLAANLATVRSLTSLSRLGRTVTGTQYVQGSVLYNRAENRLRLSAGPSIERAGISGRVFLDQNGNGRLDQGEEPLANVRISVGLESRLTDSRGEYHLWNVTPYEPAVIAVDSASLSSPLWVPTENAVAVEPTPNRYRVVDLPVSPGGVIDGKVVREHGPVAGIPLILRELASGRVRNLASFSDGEFYSMGIKPGDYELALDPRAATRLGLVAEPVRFTMAAKSDGAAVSGLIVRIR